MFAYSGPDRVSNMNTDVWLAHILSVPFEYDANHGWLGDLTQRVANDIPEGERFALSGLGWINVTNEIVRNVHELRPETLRSVRTVISNAMNVDTGEWDPVADIDMFGQMRNPGLRRLVSFGVPTGAKIDQAEYRITKNLIRRAVRQGAGPDVVAKHLAAAIRKVASDDRTVGKQVLVMIQPRPIPNEFCEVYAPMRGMTPRYDRPTCYVEGEDGELLDWSGPVFVYNGWVLQMRMSGGANEDFQFTAHLMRRGTGSAGIFFDQNGRRHGVLFRPGAVKPVGHSTIHNGATNMIGLYCPAVEVIEMVPLPDMHALNRGEQRYVMQFECAACRKTPSIPAEQVAARWGWGASFRSLARTYVCPLCGSRGARRVMAYITPDDD